MEYLQKYINLYTHKLITKCVADAIQISRSFRGESSKKRSCLVADALNIILYDHHIHVITSHSIDRVYC
jgi:acid stress-induced BolA-like protein IbaG/YrbA